ncbi:putative amidoligase domain-containing protein [Marinicrinis lubricantis]|uniref:PhiEco32-like amidoligase-type 2 protein n=1 Tax=Marinicrinis lubricantis TaxID=2086470 RepID=A0ABW1ITI4_9BACL
MGAILWGKSEEDVNTFAARLRIPACTGGLRPSKEHIVIPWKVEEYRGDCSLMLNAPSFVKRAGDRQAMERILGLWAIPHELTKSALYKVLIFQSEPLVLRKRQLWTASGGQEGTDSAERGRWTALELDHTRPLVRKLCRLAVKALYAAGLDYGEVGLHWNDKGEEAVTTIVPYPELTRSDQEKFIQAIQRFSDQLDVSAKVPDSFMIGADLEFVICRENGGIMMADRLFGKQGSIGSDSIWSRDRKMIYPLAEIRPKPGRTPEELVRSIRSTLLKAARKAPKPELIWKAGGMPQGRLELGGHLHFSGTQMNHFLMRALDNYAALPLILIEDETTSRRRPRFGFPGDVRWKSHGGFEYRTLPSWIVSPRAAKGVCALAYVIVHHYWKLQDRPLDQPETLRDYMEGHKSGLYSTVRSLWKQLEQTSTYKQYEHYLTPLKRQIFSKKSWNEQRDIRCTWMLPPYEPVTISTSPRGS